MGSDWFNTIKEKGAAIRLRLSSKWQDFSERMRHKRRLVVMDTDTFKEQFSMELTGVNVFTVVGISAITLIVLTTLLIAFTPLRGLIPGYIKTEQREEILRSAHTIDSLENVIQQNEVLISAIQDAIDGKTHTAVQQKADEIVDNRKIVYQHSKEDSLLRREVEQRHKQQAASLKRTVKK